METTGLTYVSSDSRPFGSYSDTFKVRKSEIWLRTRAAVVSLSIWFWYSSRPGTNKGSPRLARYQNMSAKRTPHMNLSVRLTSP